MKTIKSFLPVFTGFYNSVFTGIVDFEEELILDSDAEEGETVYQYDDLDFDYAKLHIDIAKGCISALQNEMILNGFKVSITFEKLVSPREYNFETDEIQCTYELSNETLKGLLGLVIDNSGLFDTYVRELFDSREGFASFNNGIKWEEVLQRYEEFFGYILQFLCDEVWLFTDEQMVDRVQGNVSLDYTVKAV